MRLGFFFALAFAGFSQTPKTFPLQTVEGLSAHNLKIAPAEHQGRKCIRLYDGTADEQNHSYALITGLEFSDGVIELELAGRPGPQASGAARGFTGLAFRVQSDGRRFENFYLRPTNGRADDQVRRNHSLQYTSEPEWPWSRLRKEFPEKYESYADLQPSVWTKVKITVDGTRARLYVHDAEQPNLIVNDLKLNATRGGIALWIGPGTEAFFANLKVTPKN